MAGLKGLAEKVASKGRYGDSELVHMNPDEIEVLEQLTGRKMTVNPDTGQPEAFSLWKLLAGIGLAAAAIPTGGLSLIGAAGIMGGLGAGLTGALGTMALTGGAGLAASSLKSKPKASDPKPSEAAAYLSARNEEAKAKNPGVPIIQARMNPYMGYDESGRERQHVTYGPPVAPMAGGIQSLMGHIGPPRFADGGRLEPEEMQAQQILNAAHAAMRGESQDPHADLSKFIETYGEDAFQNLAGGGMVSGPGGGLDDMVSAQLGNQKVLLSPDEFVIPADVVSGLGDGSSSAGARKLEAMMHRVRHERTGTTKQPGKVSGKALPR